LAGAATAGRREAAPLLISLAVTEAQTRIAEKKKKAIMSHSLAKKT